MNQKDQIIHRLRQVRESIPPCTPPLWAGTGHLQTMLGHLLPSKKIKDKGQVIHIPLEKETERIHSTYYKGTTKTIVYLFHGLGGSADASYMHRTAMIARQLGHHVFMNNHRGCGEGARLASEPYHSGRADDLSRVIAYGRQMLPEHQHIAIGFSLSANALLLLCAKVRADIRPDFAIAVNGPINLDRASIYLQTGLSKIYGDRFVKELGLYMKINRPADLGDYSRVKTLRDFDELYTAPLGGFQTRENYYETCSSGKYLSQIDIPTVILTAEDDPFVSIEDYNCANYSPSTVLHIEKCGGHMGYLSKDKLSFKRWLDLALETYLRTIGDFRRSDHH